MQPRRKNRNRPAIRIVGGVYDELIVKGECGLFQDRERIIGLQNSFRLIVERTVADENSQTARRNERAMVGGQCVDRYPLGRRRMRRLHRYQ